MSARAILLGCAGSLLALTASAWGQERRGEESSASTNAIRFMISGLESEQGHVLCALYDKKEKWLSREFLTGDRADIENGRATCVLRDVEPGRYAISAFHDEDDDEDLDRKIFGIPSEGYCASRNARARFGPPEWEDAVFEYRGGAVLTLRARMRY